MSVYVTSKLRNKCCLCSVNHEEKNTFVLALTSIPYNLQSCQFLVTFRVKKKMVLKKVQPVIQVSLVSSNSVESVVREVLVANSSCVEPLGKLSQENPEWVPMLLEKGNTFHCRQIFPTNIDLLLSPGRNEHLTIRQLEGK